MRDKFINWLYRHPRLAEFLIRLSHEDPVIHAMLLAEFFG